MNPNEPTHGAQPALLDVQAVAALLGCSTRTIYRLTDADRMPRPVRLGTLVRWNRDELLNWIASGCTPRESSNGGVS